MDKNVIVNVLKKLSTTALSGEEVDEMQTMTITSMAEVPGGRAREAGMLSRFEQTRKTLKQKIII